MLLDLGIINVSKFIFLKYEDWWNNMKVYNQIYKSIEAEVIELAFSITLSEDQKKVYSPKIADLVLRAASLLESALKYSYNINNGKSEGIKYDSNGLMKVLKLDDDKRAYVHWELYDIKKKEFIPFVKNEERVTNELKNVGIPGNQNYSWNNAYQSLRHKFVESIPHYGNIYYLFEVLAALFIVLDVQPKIFTNLTKNDEGSFQGWISTGNGISIRKTITNNKVI